ncbi:hypothetical protein ABZ342_31245 [Amycolatopsis sp. NPDC005961]|uniref:hypothetical protein n=1 Tax=Amycolatopsis sp. NPDC005961 TaxID=3156720 RepID=UPI0033DF882F
MLGSDAGTPADPDGWFLQRRDRPADWVTADGGRVSLRLEAYTEYRRLPGEVSVVEVFELSARAFRKRLHLRNRRGIDARPRRGLAHAGQ